MSHQTPPRIAAPDPNPYRSILRREFPEPLIALLVFILGLWLWDHHFAQADEYAPDTEISALLKIDRDLRLAEAMAADPAWLRSFTGVDSPEATRAKAAEGLQKLHKARAISAAGIQVFAAITAPDSTRRFPDERRTDRIFEALARGLTSQPGTVQRKHQKIARLPDFAWKASFAQDNATLRSRAIAVRSAVWLLSFGGLVFLAPALRAIRRAFAEKPSGYSSQWSVQLGLTVFLASILAWIGLVTTVELGIAAVPGFHPLLGIVLDACVRLLPASIAIAYLFRRSSHAMRSFGLDRPPSLAVVLGVLPVLLLSDFCLRTMFSPDIHSEPGAGLNAADAGLWGLAFSIVSACIVAPVSEEILYRGVLFQTLRNPFGIAIAAILSSFVFTLLHFYSGYGMASVAVFGFICALVYAATGTLATCILLHMIYNIMIKLPDWWIYHAPLG
ncbi:MAG: CPBP family intramembrane glutamic endopeptidase [Verrucomicrobiota bacterium]